MTEFISEIKAAWLGNRQRRFHQNTRGIMTPEDRQVFEQEFDRELAAHDAEVAAKAWDEGVTTALNYAKRQPDGITLKLETFDGAEWQNPYREAVQS